MFKIPRIKEIFETSLLMVILLSCNRPKDIIGEPYYAAPKDFYVVNDEFVVTPKEVNFEVQKDSFAVKFSHRVNWYINITGTESGAKRSFAGSSKEISLGELVWDGSHEHNPENNLLNFFKKGEKAVVELSILGSPIQYVDTVKIVKAKKFNDPGKVLVVATDPGLQGTLSEEGFEGIFKIANNPIWSYGPYFDKNEKTYADFDSLVPQVQGQKAFTLAGNDLSKSYFIGGVKRTIISSEYSKLPASAEGVFVNLYIYGLGDANSKLNFSFEEDDNGNGKHDPALDDAFEKQFSLDHVGWKLFSLKYSDLSRATNPKFGGNGNNIKEPSKIRGVAFNLISGEPGKSAKATFDFPTITVGGPFNP